jgi:transposase
MDLRQMAELEKADGAPTELHEKARHLRTIASVSTFRQWVSKQAAKTGSRVNALALKSSSLCHKCGEAVKASSTNVRTCLGCGSSWDEDENAAINLHRALGS